MDEKIPVKTSINDRVISLIVAASTNNAIGKNNQLLWHLPLDLKFFKNTTWGFPVIMGRKTYESVNKPLPGRNNIVISSNPDWKAENVVSAINLEESLLRAAETNCNQVFIIGGGEIYKQAIDFADNIYMTRVHTKMDADVFFPVIEEEKWALESYRDYDADEKHAYDYSFQFWKKKERML